MGIVAIVTGLGIQDMTFIESYIPLLFSGVVIAIVVALSQFRTFSLVKTNVLALVLGVGGIAYGLFFSANYYLSNNTPTPLTYPIAEKGCKNCAKGDKSQHMPEATVIAGGKKRDFTLHHADFQDLENADSLVLITYKGALGFTVVKGWRLNK